MTTGRIHGGWVLVVGLALGAIRASADDGGSPPIAAENDPLEARDLAGLEDDARAIRAASVAASRRPPEPIEGEVLTARPGTRELAYDVTIAPVGTVATLRIEARIGNRGEHTTDVRWRLPFAAPFLIEDASVCIADGARCTARDTDVETSPDSVGIAFTDLPAGADARISVRALVPVSIRGGVARVVLPPRRGDVRVGSASVRFEGDGPTSIDGTAFSGVPIEVDASRPIEVRAGLPSTGAVVTALVDGRCGTSRCAAFEVVAMPLPTPARATSLLLVVDASRSTEGDARNRALAVLDTLRALAPEVEVRIVAFGEEPRLLTDAPRRLGSVPRSVFVDACATPLGSTTRPDRALARFGPLRGETVVLIGDGGVTPSRDADEVARHFARAHVDVRYLDVSTRGMRRELVRFLDLARARTIHVGVEADEAVRTGSSSWLREVLGEVVDRSPPVVVRLRTADGGTSEHLVARGSGFFGAFPAGLRADVGGRRVARAPSSTSHEARLAALAGGVVRAAPVATMVSPPESIPREIVQTMVRSQVIPKARGCLRDDRRGRARYSVRAELAFRFADREVTDVEVSGALEAPLRACLFEAISHLEVPRFEGAVRVRYPIRTLEAEEPPTYDLDVDVRDRVDAIGAPLPGTAGDVLEDATRR